MANRKRKPARVAVNLATQEEDNQAAKVTASDKMIISGPKLRAALSISAPTLWRWRRDKDRNFPVAKKINGRLYFPWDEVRAWVARQPDGA